MLYVDAAKVEQVRRGVCWRGRCPRSTSFRLVAKHKAGGTSPSRCILAEPRCLGASFFCPYSVLVFPGRPRSADGLAMPYANLPMPSLWIGRSLSTAPDRGRQRSRRRRQQGRAWRKLHRREARGATSAAGGTSFAPLASSQSRASGLSSPAPRSD
jgi:hypothetical protein